MNTVTRALVSLLVGFLVFVAVGTGITAWMVRWIEFSLMLGIPMGLTAGLTAVATTFVILGYWTARSTRSVSHTAVRRLWAGSAAAITYVLLTGVGLALFFYGDGDDGVAILVFGLPVGVPLGALVGYVVARVTHETTPNARTPT